MKLPSISIIVIFLSLSVSLISQDKPERWANEIKEISKKYQGVDLKDAIIFTGSSSVRLWKDLESRYSKYNILNTGFGGSAMHELNFWSGNLIEQYHPKKVFIYEGDNDVSAGLSPDFVIEHAKEIILKLKTQNPSVLIYFISPKPSPSRWHLKDKYDAMNSAIRKLCEESDGVTYVDVWPHMLDNSGVPFDHIFIQDKLHMNTEGYDIWDKIVRPYVEE